ncbi:MAG: MBL fold metallo-hydrolase [Planctomycetaceae bacterium]|nr:MAG: MBL fold metallo-hydrolase [Planctomycetaceae bacterium]
MVISLQKESILSNENNAPQDPADVPKMLTLAPGFCVRQAIDNIAWIDMGEYAVVIDTLEQAELEEEIFAAIQKTIGNKPVRYVINTHTHYDHVALNDAFRRRYAAEVVNAQTKCVPPEGLRYDGTKRSIQILSMPGCHTEEDLVVWVEPERALFVGDIFGWGLIPLIVNLRRETADTLVNTYTRLIKLAPDVIIPGHGPLCTTTELKRWLAYFSRLQADVAAACKAGRDNDDILRSIAPPEDMKTWWRFLKWKHQDCIAKVLKAVRKGWL